jgi:hypothetical protein
VAGLTDSAVLSTATPAISVGLSAAAIAQGALSGAIIGGLAAGSWRGAGTGALLAGGIGGAFAVIALMIAGSANPALRVGGAVGLVAGGVALVAGGKRSRDAMRGKRA